MSVPGLVGLAALEERLRQDKRWLEWPSRPWIPPRFYKGERVLDVVVVGAGMCGLAASAAMLRLGIANIAVLDRAPAGREGPWVTFARMTTLRSPKQLTGPALGLPSLTFRAWFEAQFGEAAWSDLGKIPREQWMAYLVWYRRVMDVAVQNDVQVEGIEPGPYDLLTLALQTPLGERRIVARKIVLATGRDGLGGAFVPRFMAGVDRRFWAHSSDAIDFAILAGRRVGIVGAGASAIDNAACALEAGAASVDLFIRRADLPRINKMTGIGSPGLTHGFSALPDDAKWRFMHYAASTQTPPPRDSTLRVSRFPNARFRLNSPVLSVDVENDALLVRTPQTRVALDFLILGTGFASDIERRAELTAFAPHIRLWSDRYTPTSGSDNAEMASFPDLGPAFEFQEKMDGACPALNSIHCFNYPALLSHGKLSGDIPAVSEGAWRLAEGLARTLFVEDRDVHFRTLQDYATPELLGDEWTPYKAD